MFVQVVQTDQGFAHHNNKIFQVVEINNPGQRYNLRVGIVDTRWYAFDQVEVIDPEVVETILTQAMKMPSSEGLGQFAFIDRVWQESEKASGRKLRKDLVKRVLRSPLMTVLGAMEKVSISES